MDLIAKLAASVGLNQDDKIQKILARSEENANDDADNLIERRSFCDSTTIASKEDDESDYDELGRQKKLPEQGLKYFLKI
jgi:hypothetical protein